MYLVKRKSYRIMFLVIWRWVKLLLTLKIFTLFYCRADWGYESIVDKPLRLLFPYSLTLIHCPQAPKYPEYSDQDGTLWGWGAGHGVGKVQVALSHTKIFRSLTTPRLAHFFSICSVTWHQDSNPYTYGRTGVLDSRYPKNKTRASRQNRKLVEVEGPSGLAPDFYLGVFQHGIYA